jgi:molybdopterin synthase sulfur carrier subunit
MTVNVLAFGIAKDIFGGSSIEIELNDADVRSLKALLEERYERLKNLKSYMVAVNNEYAADDKPISATDEIAIIPPVSGG